MEKVLVRLEKLQKTRILEDCPQGCSAMAQCVTWDETAMKRPVRSLSLNAESSPLLLSGFPLQNSSVLLLSDFSEMLVASHALSYPS